MTGQSIVSCRSAAPQRKHIDWHNKSVVPLLRLPQVLQTQTAAFLDKGDLVAVAMTSAAHLHVMTARWLWSNILVTITTHPIPQTLLPALSLLKVKLFSDPGAMFDGAHSLREVEFDYDWLKFENVIRGPTWSATPSELRHVILRAYHLVLHTHAMALTLLPHLKSLRLSALVADHYQRGNQQLLAEYDHFAKEQSIDHSAVAVSTDELIGNARLLYDIGQLNANNSDIGLSLENVRRRHAGSLLFFNSLSTHCINLQYLQLRTCRVTPYILRLLPIFPHLLILDLSDISLVYHDFARFPTCFPSLRTLVLSTCNDRCLQTLSGMSSLTELIFPNYPRYEEEEIQIITTEIGWNALGRMKQLKSLIFYPEDSCETIYPSLADMKNVFGLSSSLVRLTMDAAWFDRLQADVFCHQSGVWSHLRCFQLIPVLACSLTAAYQTDRSLAPFIKVAAGVVKGREERQHHRRLRHPMYNRFEQRGDGQIDVDWAGTAVHKFPALECLDLPYHAYECPRSSHSAVSKVTIRELRRSYEYENINDWEAETCTVGVAEWARQHLRIPFRRTNGRSRWY